jgi:lactose/L-arabinose transport system permease protein
MIDINKIPSPCYVMEEKLLRNNLSLIKSVKERAGVNIILAFKAFALWKAFPIVREYIPFSTASSKFEAQLAFEEMGSPAHTYSPAYTEADFPLILRYSSHVTFNSLSQFHRFYPMVRAFIISLQKGTGANMRFTGFSNYQRILVDKVFQQSIGNTFFYLIIQVPIMLILAILLAQLLNNKHLKLRGLFRTCVFLPCATSLVSYSLIFRSMFATDGLINSILMKLGILHSGYNFLGHSGSAKAVIILALIWRWTGYNMVFYLAGLQNIEYSVYEAAKIDGANGWKTFWRITVPLLKPTIIMTFIMSINGTLQLFDESVNLTKGGPANTTITMSHYVYNTCFINVPNFGYAAAMSFLIFIMVAILAFINLKVGDTRD